MGRSDGAASKSSILPSAVGEADLEAQRASNLAAYMPRCGFRRPRSARLEVRKQRLRTGTPGQRIEGALQRD